MYVHVKFGIVYNYKLCFYTEFTLFTAMLIVILILV